MDLNLTTIRNCLSFYPNVEYTIDEIVDIISSDKFIKRATLHERILELVLKEFNVTKKEIQSKSKIRKLADARKVYSYLSIKHSLATNLTIGKLIGRDHSTINVAKSWITKNVIGNNYYKKIEDKIVLIEEEIYKIK